MCREERAGARSGRFARWVFLALVACAATTPVQAQTDPADRRAAALRAFEAGEAAAAEERWADAITSFQEAYDLTGVPTALFNVAYALRALGRYVEARAAFDELLELRLSDDDRTDAENLRAEMHGRIAHVRIDGLDADVAYELRLDGQVVDDTLERPASLDCDPGSHRIEVRRTGYVAFEWSGVLGEGQTRELSAALTPLPSVDRELTEEPWFWVVVGVGGALVIGGALIGGFVGDDQAQLRPDPTRTLVRL